VTPTDALKDLAAKRAAAVAAKDAAAPVKLNYVDIVPPGFKTKAPPPPPSSEEDARLARLDRRRAFRIDARRVFRLADADDSKSLEFHELARLVASHDVAAQAFERMDSDKDGVIVMEEWLDFMLNIWEHTEAGAEHVLERAEDMIRRRYYMRVGEMLFNKFDANSDGKLDHKEVARFMRRQDGGSDAFRFMQFVDDNNSGAIDRQEWAHYLDYMWDMAGCDMAWELIFMLYERFHMGTPNKI